MPYGYGASKNYGGSTARERGAARNRTQSTSTKKSSPSKTTNYNNNTKKSVTSGTLSDPREKDDTAAKMDLFKNDPYTKKQGGPLILKPAEPLFDAGAKKTRQYFTSEVLGKGAYKGTSRQDFEKMSRTAQESMYKDYITGRSSGKTDAYGREIISTGDGGGATESSGVVVQAPKVETTPTESEVSQATTTDAEDPILLRKRKAKARGRSPTILTGVTGATGSLTLGKPSLLGS